MNTFSECFKIILTEDKDASRQAARAVRKLVYSSHGGKDEFDEMKNIINNAANEYANISEKWRQENFVMAVSVMYFLHDKEKRPDFLFPWLFDLLQHENGYIRHAAVRMFENELGPLTYHIRYPNRKTDFFHLRPEQADRILFGLFANLVSLMNDLWKSAYKKYKYVSSLPSDPYKSVQMVLGCLGEYCGERYMKRLEETVQLSRSRFLDEI